MPATKTPVAKTADAVLVTLADGKEVWMSENQRDALDMLETAQHGAFAAIKGYKPSSGYKVSPTKNYQFISKFSTVKLYERKIAELKKLNFTDLDISKCDEKVSKLTKAEQIDLFNERRGMEIASMERTLHDCREDAKRQGHDRCYGKSSLGIRVHLFTEKGKDGLKHPVLVDGYPVVQSIIINAIVTGCTTVEEGESKPAPKSGAPVQIGNAMKAAIKSRTINMQTFSLKADNFASLHISGFCLDPDDCATMADLKGRVIGKVVVDFLCDLGMQQTV